MAGRKSIFLTALLLIFASAAFSDYHYLPYMNGVDETLMPAYLWYAGCVPTSACMVLGYWDNYGEMGGGNYGKNTHYGKLIQYYLDKLAMTSTNGWNGAPLSWSFYGDNVPKTKTHYELAYYMQTASDGSTYYNMAPAALTTVAGSRGYLDATSSDNPGSASNDWSWQTLVDSINSGKPCVWYNNSSGKGHALAAWGYSDDKYVIVYNTWDEMRHDYYYQYYNGTTGTPNTFTGVITFDPGTMGMDSDVELFSPDGGETWLNNTPQTIHWQQYGTSIDALKIFYSVNGGLNWTALTTTASAAGDDNYIWPPPGTISSARMRVRIEGWSGGGSGQHYGDDGSQQDFLCAAATFTVTPTRTMTSTRTPTKTMTFTVSPTWSTTKTFTVSPTVTETFTASETGTVTQTSTESETVSMTATPTVTETFSMTLTQTPTFTWTQTPTTTVTPTGSETTTITATDSATQTATGSFTATYSPTWTQTTGETATYTATPSVTCTVVFTASATCTVTLGTTATATPAASGIPGDGNDVLIYPNPAKDHFIAGFKAGGVPAGAEVLVYTEAFRLIMRASFEAVDISGADGSYYVSVKLPESLARVIYFVRLNSRGVAYHIEELVVLK